VQGTFTLQRKDVSAKLYAYEFWLSVCRRSRQIDDVTGERKDVYYLGMRKEEVWVRYVSHCVETLAPDGEHVVGLPDLKFGDIHSVDFPDDFYTKYTKKVLKRTAFKAAMPPNVRIEKFVESSCPMCRDGMRAQDHLDKCQHGDNVPDDMAEDERAEFDEQVQEWKKQVREMEAHRVVVTYQRTEQQKQRDNVGLSKRNGPQYPDVVVVFDFSPFSKVRAARVRVGVAVLTVADVGVRRASLACRRYGRHAELDRHDLLPRHRRLA
jgi:hypothetical protein